MIIQLTNQSSWYNSYEFVVMGLELHIDIDLDTAICVFFTHAQHVGSHIDAVSVISIYD